MFISRENIIAKLTLFSAEKQPFVFAIDFDGKNGFVLSPEEAEKQGIRYDIGEMKSCESRVSGHAQPATRNPQPVTRNPFRFNLSPVSFETYRAAFEKVSFHLHRGDTYLLNLTFPTRLDTDLTLEEIYARSSAPFRLLVPGRFVVFSPEPFVRIEDGKITSRPMKGTISAEIPDAEERLLADEKELFEHHTIVDLIRNDLSMVATGVRVAKSRVIDRIRTNRGELLQMSSEITGTLPPDWRSRMGEILFTLLPAGSVTGAPKEKTVQIIRGAEGYDRGFYTGIFGAFDGSALSTAVTIRYIEKTPQGLVFKSGGGITALSEAVREYDELKAKVYVPFA